MMETPQDVLIKGDRHLIIHGQFGNLQAKINILLKILNDSGMSAFVPALGEIEAELVFLKKMYPALEGEERPALIRAILAVDKQTPPRINLHRSKAEIRNALKDMRLLMDVAATTYQVEGNIDCHLKVMLDEAWGKAAILAGIDVVDDLPV